MGGRVKDTKTIIKATNYAIMTFQTIETLLCRDSLDSRVALDTYLYNNIYIIDITYLYNNSVQGKRRISVYFVPRLGVRLNI